MTARECKFLYNLQFTALKTLGYTSAVKLPAWDGVIVNGVWLVSGTASLVTFICTAQVWSSSETTSATSTSTWVCSTVGTASQSTAVLGIRVVSATGSDMGASGLGRSVTSDGAKSDWVHIWIKRINACNTKSWWDIFSCHRTSECNTYHLWYVVNGHCLAWII